MPENFHAVSQYYRDFAQTDDEEVTSLLDEASRRSLAPAAEKLAGLSTVSECMDHDATVVGPYDNVARAAAIMRDWKVGVLPVCDGRRLVGMLSDSDIRSGTVREDRAEEEIRVAELMSEDLAWCFEDESIAAVMHRFGDSRLERIPVLDRQKNLVGMLNIDRGTDNPHVTHQAHSGDGTAPLHSLSSEHANRSF